MSRDLRPSRWWCELPHQTTADFTELHSEPRARRSERTVGRFLSRSETFPAERRCRLNANYYHNDDSPLRILIISARANRTPSVSVPRDRANAWARSRAASIVYRDLRRLVRVTNLVRNARRALRLPVIAASSAVVTTPSSASGASTSLRSARSRTTVIANTRAKNTSVERAWRGSRSHHRRLHGSAFASSAFARRSTAASGRRSCAPIWSSRPPAAVHAHR